MKGWRRITTTQLNSDDHFEEMLGMVKIILAILRDLTNSPNWENWSMGI